MALRFAGWFTGGRRTAETRALGRCWWKANVMGGPGQQVGWRWSWTSLLT